MNTSTMNTLSLPLVNQDSAQALSPQSPKSPLVDFAHRSIELSGSSYLEETDNVLENVPDAPNDTLDPRPVDNETESLGLRVVKHLKGKLGCRHRPLCYIKRHIEYCIRIKVEEGLAEYIDVYFKYSFGTFDKKVKERWINCDSTETLSFDRFNK
uniref:Uncharacterized protein n=1 Tax=Amphimedon queenslandica TaxID=400682 RepID=A0A1X7SL56_AMPQE